MMLIEEKSLFSWDWCIRYLKTFYPNKTWDAWKLGLYWGHFHEALTPPFILKHFNGEYYLCLAIQSHEIVLVHPTMGEKKYLLTAVQKDFFNEVVGYQQQNNYCLQQRLSKQIVSHFMSFLWQNPRRLLTMALFFLSYEVFALIEPLGLSLLFEHVDLFSGDLDLNLYLLFIGFGMLTVWVLSYYKQRITMIFLGKNAHFFAVFAWSRYFFNSLSEVSKHLIGEVYPRLFSLEQIVYRLLQQFVYSGFDGLFLGLNLGVLAFINWHLACIDGLSLICMFGLSMLALKDYQRSSNEVLEFQQALQAHALETLQHLSETKLWQKEHLFLGRWKEKISLYWHAFLSNELAQFKIEWFIDGLKKLNILLVIGFAFYLIRHQQLSIGFLIAYIGLKIQVFSRFESVIRRLNRWQYLKAPLAKLTLLFQARPQKEHQILSATLSQDYQISITSIRLGEQFFKPIKFDWGKNYLIEGPSGRGKTSLLKSIMGLASAMQAKVIYRGRDCIDDDWRQLRQEVAIILAGHGLWQGSLVDNISMFDPKPDIKLIKNLMLDLSIDMDLDVCFKKDFSGFSAGQTQKILLARALYRKPKWLILDEATCHLDEDSESLILERLCAYDCSLIVVNHRQHVAHFFDEHYIWDDFLP
jgi:ATP-binding cassette subfamily B protein RaxB